MFFNIKEAILSAILAGILIFPVFGWRLFKSGGQFETRFEPANILLTMGVVFAIFLCRPLWSQMLKVMPKFRSLELDDEQQGRVIRWFFIAAFLFPVLMILQRVTWPGRDYRVVIDVSSIALTYVILGLSLNIIVGYAGLLNLGHVAFYGIGGYVFGCLFKFFGWGFWSSLPVAVFAAGLAGFLVSLPLLRLRGDYLAIVTLAFAEILRQVFNNEVPLFGGPDGIAGLPKPAVMGFEMLRRGDDTFHSLLGLTYDSRHMVIWLYFIVLALTLVTYLVSQRLLKMPLGRALEALREDEIACQSLGINPAPVKIWAFTIGSAMAGAAGAFFATRNTMINPDCFQFLESIMILVAVVLGGMGSNLGVIIGSIVIVMIQEYGRDLAEYRMLVFGVLLVVMMLWKPQGFLPAKRKSVELPS
ncbi:MAG: high-affinity branched-chain amino acid ABC transporter permease LivM [Methylobacteriaceae bacterium]|jgi:branched-chain amino acid transport system permease protein|nr:high-affinity branched-chain amino acid ABC transporter permease LivM [Methylobacteriaceae bacterium]